ncbi:MAG: hypothetical protein ACT4O9_10725 [Blastocatellia bacterium]
MFETKLEKIIGDEKKLRQLLSLEKKRRGMSENTLIFVGTSNVANHWWCTQKAVFQSKSDEVMFFGVYLRDRINYARKLGQITNLPRKNEELLSVGSNISLEDINQLLREENGKTKRETKGPFITRIEALLDKDGNTTYLVIPDASPEEVKLFGLPESQLVYDIEADPLFRGEIYHERYAEKYPSIRWNFRWEHYSVIGEPDGLTDDFVYEYKTTRERYLYNFVKPVAVAQADLYGYFFGSRKKKVQIHIIGENRTETFEGDVDVKKAEDTLNAFASAVAGGIVYPPKKWKCNKCEFRSDCHIRTD